MGEVLVGVRLGFLLAASGDFTAVCSCLHGHAPVKKYKKYKNKKKPLFRPNY